MIMDIKHTKEPWFSDGECIWRRNPRELYQNGGGVAGDKPIAIVNKGWHGEEENGYPVFENAKRIVACVNACAEIENKELEAVSYTQLLESHHLLQNQVALAEALVEALSTIRHDAYMDSSYNKTVIEIYEVADKAIMAYDKLSEVNHDTNK